MVALTTTALLLALVLLHPCAGDQDLTLNLLPPNSVPPTLRSYNLLDNFCLLQQHASTRVGNLLLLDGGLAKYKITKDGISYGVADLNGFTVALDLAADFSTNTPPLKQLTKKPAAVVSEHGMWTDGASVWIQGGVFDADYANSSAWYVETAMIPPYEIWVLHAGSERWEKETVRVQDGSVVERTAAGAGACSEDTCYWLGWVGLW